jgi:methylmalonyl-CoA mutase N-terminal domain/subunit
MCEWDERDELKRERQRWEETTLRRNLKRLGLERSPVRLYTPLDVKPKRYMERLGFPGEYPFTRGTYAVPLMATAYGGGCHGRPSHGGRICRLRHRRGHP